MSRKPTPEPTSREAPINMAAVEEDFAAANSLAVLVTEQNQRVAMLARRLNYTGTVDPGVLENSAREAIGRIGAGLFELGAYLLLLRENTARGDFVTALGRLGLEPRVAQRYMQVTFRFANAPSRVHLEHLGKTKMLELLALDDEQIEELAIQGQTGDLVLDAAARMSVRELRAKVREQAKDAAANEKLLARKDERINKLMRDAEHFALAPPSEQIAELQAAATKAANLAMVTVRGPLHQAVLKLQALGDPAQQLHFMAGLVASVQAAINDLRSEHQLPDVSHGQSAVQIEGMRLVREALAKSKAERAAKAAEGGQS